MAFGFGINNTVTKPTTSGSFGFGIKKVQNLIGNIQGPQSVLQQRATGLAQFGITEPNNSLKMSQPSTLGGPKLGFEYTPLTQAPITTASKALARDLTTEQKNKIRGGSFADTLKEVDHIVSVALGGTNADFNLQALSSKDQRQEGKLAVEQDNINKFQNGELTQGQAIYNILQYSWANDATKKAMESQSLASVVKAQVKRDLPATTEVLQSIKKDPFSLEVFSNPKKLYDDTLGQIANTAKDEWQRIKDVFINSKGDTSTQFASKQIRALTGGASVLFSPISAAFSLASDIPVIGTLVKLATLPFPMASDVTTDVAKPLFSKVVEKLPVAEKDKTALVDASTEITSLAAQIFIGGKVFETGKEFLLKKEKLVTKFGEKDAETIVKLAEEKAKNTQELAKETPTKTSQFGFGIERQVETPKSPDVITTKDIADLKPVEVNIKDLKIEPFDSNIAKQDLGTANDTQTRLPVLVTKNADGSLGVLDGNGRILKAQQAGETTIKVTTNEKLYKELSTKVEVPTSPKTAPTSKISGEVGKVSKPASEINTKLVEQGFKAIPEEKLAKYTPTTKKETIETVSKVLENDIELAKRIATGKEESKLTDVEKQVLFNTLEKKAIKENDIQLLVELAKSPIATERSVAAQTLGSSAWEKDSVIKNIQEAIKVREANFEAKTGKKVNKAKKDAVDEIKKELKKSKPKVKDWTSFIESIKC